MAYNKTNWQNSPSTDTPINANNLNKIEEGIYQNSLKADQVGDLTNLETTSKTTCVSAINELKDGLDQKQDAFIIENVTLGTNLTFNANNGGTFQVPARTGYTAYVLKPYVTGAWSDKYAVYIPFNAINTFGIANISSTQYTWSVYCAVLYIKNTE